MPTQVQSLITPEYTNVVSVAADTEVLTEAQLTDTAVALGNRIEFVRTLTPAAALTPERFAIADDDFHGIHFNGTTKIISKEVWTMLQSGAGAGGLALGQAAGTVKNPGNLTISTPGTLGDCKISWFLGNAATGNAFDFQFVDSFTLVVKVAADNTALGVTRIRVGLAEDQDSEVGGTDSIGILYDPLTGGNLNWQLLVRKASSATASNLVLATIGEYQVFRFQKNAAGDFEVYVGGVLTATVAFANLPTGACSFGGIQKVDGVTGAQALTAHYDFMFIRSDCGNRSGP